jgi:hypothetical protein
MRAFSLLFVLVSVADAAGRPTVPTDLPEVVGHMRDGRACLASGDRDLAAAHARLILVSHKIKIRLSTAGYSPSAAAHCRRALVEACDIWQSALDDSFEFVLVDAQTQADVYAIFQPDVRLQGEPVAGYVRWQRTLQADAGKVVVQGFRADMQLRTVRPGGQPMPSAAMRHEACHELGHVLGLDDTEKVGAVMGPLDIEHPASGPTAAEVATVRQIRQDANQLLTDSQRTDTVAGASAKPVPAAIIKG